MPDFKHISDGINTWDIPTPVKFAEIGISSSGMYPSTMGNDSQHIINVIQAYRNSDITITNIPSANLVAWVAAGYAVYVRIVMNGFGSTGDHRTEYAILTSNGAGTPGYIWTNYGNGGLLYFNFNSTYTGLYGTNAVSGQINRLTPEKIGGQDYPGMGDVMTDHASLVNGDVLTWSANADRWVAQQPGGGGGGGSDKVYYLFDANQPGNYSEGMLTTLSVNQESQYMILCSDTAGQTLVTVGDLIDELSSNYTDVNTPKSIIIQTNKMPLHCSYITSVVSSLQVGMLYGDAVIFSMYVSGPGMMTFALVDDDGRVKAYRIS